MSKTGTKEWSTHSVNCISGCSHDCIYCYAAHDQSIRWKRRARSDWGREVVNQTAAEKAFKCADGVTMFPTTHDITPRGLKSCMRVLRRLLVSGRRVLIVSKPHLDCIRAICHDGTVVGLEENVEFRFSITCLSDKARAFWEPGAPTIPERVACLAYAHAAGFKTSVSMEPLLEPWAAKEIVQLVEPVTTGEIWIGMLNQMASRCGWVRDAFTAEQRTMYARLRRWQTTPDLVYDSLKDHPQVRWKDSYRKALGLLEAEAGD